jgi:hypothetical protein
MLIYVHEPFEAFNGICAFGSLIGVHASAGVGGIIWSLHDTPLPAWRNDSDDERRFAFIKSLDTCDSDYYREFFNVIHQFNHLTSFNRYNPWHWFWSDEIIYMHTEGFYILA